MKFQGVRIERGPATRRQSNSLCPHHIHILEIDSTYPQKQLKYKWLTI